MRTVSLRGSPTVMRDSLAAIASEAAPTRSAGTNTRRIAVHFCPDFTVISRTTSLTNRSKDSLPGAVPGSRTAAFRLSASMLTRTERPATAGCDRMIAAVSAEPVNDTTSNGCSASISPAELPQTMDSAPGGNTPASMTSWTMRCVSHAVAVAGLTITGTPESSAGAAFSHKPQDGKLNALMNSATPRVGVAMCWLWNDGSLPRRAGSPSTSRRASPSESPSFA